MRLPVHTDCGLPFALGVIAEGLGVALVPTQDPASADLLYSAEVPQAADHRAVWIRRDQPPRTLEEAGIRFQAARRALNAGSSGLLRIQADLVSLAETLLSGRLEDALPRNEFGVPLLAGNAADLLRRPALSELIEALGRVLDRRQPAGHRVSRWPMGKRAALLITHDVDLPARRPGAAFYRRRIRRDLLRGSPVAASRALAGWIRTRLSAGTSLPQREDPNFGFRYWREAERALGGKGCFYVAVTSSADADGHPSDVPYDAGDPALVEAMREAVASGWEIGLHASIRCATTPGLFAREKERLETLLGAPVQGVRHHYWALKAGSPGETWRAQAQAGFAYDSSLGTNDAPGFRRGLAWPFRPRAGLPLQVPPTLMDGGVFYADPGREAGVRAVREHLSTVFQAGGAAVLDWHLEQSNPVRLGGAGPALQEALDLVRARCDLWIATPGEVCDWWTERAARLQALSRERPRIRTSRPAVPPPAESPVRPFDPGTRIPGS